MPEEAADALKILWQHMANKALGGYKFLRNQKIGPETVHFVCPDLNFAVQVDDGTQDETTVQSFNDVLTEKGYTVIRFWPSDVTGRTDAVMLEIIKVIMMLEHGHGHDHDHDHDGHCCGGHHHHH